ATPLVVAEGEKVLGIIALKDIVKGGIKERFAQLRKMGIKTVRGPRRWWSPKAKRCWGLLRSKISSKAASKNVSP
ncbi:hypothetical protein CQA81_31605, partial [Klebsiella pneumoniae]